MVILAILFIDFSPSEKITVLKHLKLKALRVGTRVKKKKNIDCSNCFSIRLTARHVNWYCYLTTHTQAFEGSQWTRRIHHWNLKRAGRKEKTLREISSVRFQKLVKTFTASDKLKYKAQVEAWIVVSSALKEFSFERQKLFTLKYFPACHTNLKRVPAFRNRYVGGGEARAFDACLSRLSIISLGIEKRLFN